MKFAVIRTGGKQYLVEEGTLLSIERLPGEEKELTFNEVLLVGDGDHVRMGTPLVADAHVSASREGEIRGKRVVTLKYKPKARTRVKGSSRQLQTKVRITSIS